jgi:hypothetical protein
MLIVLAAITLLAVAVPNQASDSLFAKLVEATSRSDQAALTRLLSFEALSASTATVGKDHRRSSGPLRHGVPAREIAETLRGCSVKQWRNTGSEHGQAYILWECPTKRVVEHECYFFSYRAEMLDPRYHPSNLFVNEMPSRDDVPCGQVPIPPPRH